MHFYRFSFFKNFSSCNLYSILYHPIEVLGCSENQVLAARSPHLLDFHEDLTSLEAASKVFIHLASTMDNIAVREILFLELFFFTQIQLKSLAEEMQAIVKGLEKVELELHASENDGPVSEVFRKV